MCLNSYAKDMFISYLFLLFVLTFCDKKKINKMGTKTKGIILIVKEDFEISLKRKINKKITKIVIIYLHYVNKNVPIQETSIKKKKKKKIKDSI